MRSITAHFFFLIEMAQIMASQSPKKIYINGRFLTQPHTGVQRFARELLNALDLEQETNPGLFLFTCLIPPNTKKDDIPAWNNIIVRSVGRLTENLWEQVDLPFFARDGMLLGLCNINPIFHFNQCIIFHDASVFAVPAAYSFAFKMKYKLVMAILGRTAKRIFTDSQFSRTELSRYLGIPENKITVVPGGSEHILNISPDKTILTHFESETKPFLLAVGSSSPHKNITRLVEVIDGDVDGKYLLVIAGGTFSNVFNNVEIKNNPRIITLGFVSDSQLRALYSRAAGLIFPSIYEGFGLPPLEAMSCGCPVLCSDIPALNEICGDAVVYFNPLNKIEISEVINRFFSIHRESNLMQKKGFEQVKFFTWQLAAQRLLSAIIDQDVN